MGHAGHKVNAVHSLSEKANRFHLTSRFRSVPSGCSVEEDSEIFLLGGP